MAIASLNYKKGTWAKKHKQALIKGVLTAQEDLQGARYWSKHEKVAVEKTIAECAQRSQKKDKKSVWTSDELSALAGAIADDIRQALIKLDSWSEGEMDGLFDSVFVAVHQIFNDKSSEPYLPVEDEIFTLYSNDYDQQFAQRQPGNGTNVGEETNKPKTKTGDTKKWQALAPLIHTKLPFRTEHQITLRATAMLLKSKLLTPDR